MPLPHYLQAWWKFIPILTATLSSCSPALADGALLSGITGNITLSPVCAGPQRSGLACEKPFRGARVQLIDETGHIVGSVVTGTKGRFRFVAPPGTYRIHVETSRLYPRCEEAIKNIPSQGFAHVHVACDTGIR